VKTDPEIDDLQQRLTAARSALVNDMGGAVDSARTLADWRQHFRAHPLLFCGAAAALGFLLVPRRRRPAPSAFPAGSWPAQGPLPGAGQPVPEAARTVEEPAVMKALLLLAATHVAREAAGFAARRGQDWLRKQVRAWASRRNRAVHERAVHDDPAEMEFDDYSHP
jgi:hypothetical protein